MNYEESDTPEAGTAAYDLGSAEDALFDLFNENADPETDTGEEQDDSADDFDPVEDTEDDANDDSEADENDEDEEEDDDAEHSATEYEVTLPDGTTQKVPVEELRKGYLRQADYSRKMNEVGEARKLAAVYSEKLEALTALLPSPVPEEELDRLFHEDRDGYLTAKRHNEKLTAIYRQREAMQRRQAAEAARDFEEFRRAEVQKIQEVIPEWRNPEVMEKEANELGSFMSKHGFEEELINQTVDHRIVKLLRMAKAYEDLQTRRPKSGEEKPKAKVKAGKSKRPNSKRVPNKRRYSENEAWEALLDFDL